MKIVRVAVRGWVEVAIYGLSEDSAAGAIAVTALSNELNSWLQALCGNTDIGDTVNAYVDDWSFAEGFEAGEVRGA